MSQYTVFDVFQDAILVIDSEMRLHYGNEAASLLFELSSRRLSSGKQIQNMVTFEPDPIASAGLESLGSATQVKEVAFSSTGGKEGWAQVSVQPQPEFF